MEDALYTRVLQYLNIRPRSEKEVRDYIAKQLAKPKVRKLFERHFERSEESQSKAKDPWTSLRFAQVMALETQAHRDDTSIADRLVARLKSAKFLDDLQFTLWFIRSRTTFKPKGRRLITLELQQKGIKKELIDEAFIEFDKDQIDHAEEKRDEVALAKELLEKKRKRFETMDRQERFNKAGSMLARRGFDLDTIKKAFQEMGW